MTDASGSTSQETQDIRLSLEGDGLAYQRIVERHEQEIGQYVWRFTRVESDWEELVQEVFVEGYLSLRSYRGHAPLVHWLKRIATRVGYRYWRKRSKEKERAPQTLEGQLETLSDAGSLQAIESVEAGELVHYLLEKLSQRDRLVLTVVYLDGNSVAEAATLLNWSQTMVKVQLHRARKKMERLLQQETKSNENL